MVAKTLLNLRTELAQRLGFSSSGSGAILQKDLLNSALRGGQEQLFYEFGDLLTHRVNDTTPGITTASKNLYALPDDCDPNKPLTVSAQHTTGGVYVELQIGIGIAQHNSDPVINDQFPTRWDILNEGLGKGSVSPKLELWPTPDDSYKIKLEYNAALGPLEEDSDTTTINPQLVLLHGIVTMKAHYQQQDYNLYAGQLQALLGRLKTIALQAGGSVSYTHLRAYVYRSFHGHGFLPHNRGFIIWRQKKL